MQHIKLISMKMQSRCNVQGVKVLQPQEVYLGGHGQWSDMVMKGEAVSKGVMQHIKSISMRRQRRCNAQCVKVLQPQEVDLGGRRHGHKGWSSVEVGHAAHQIDQHENAKQMQCTRCKSSATPRSWSWWPLTWWWKVKQGQSVSCSTSNRSAWGGKEDAMHNV